MYMAAGRMQNSLKVKPVETIVLLRLYGVDETFTVLGTTVYRSLVNA